MNFSDNLIKLRKTKGWSQEDLADKLSLSRQAISKWEVGTSKPDIDNLINLSKLFKVSIDQLVNNEIIVTEAVSFDVKKNDKKKKVLTLLKRLFIVLAIIYVVNVIYNFAVLFTITQAELKYKELDNYHYIITTYDNEGLREKEECWFKDGVLKKISKIYSKNEINTLETYINYNEKTGYMKNNNDEKINITKEIVDTNFSNLNSLYNNFPKTLTEKDIEKIFLNSLKYNYVNIKQGKDLIFINTEKEIISINKDNLIPKANHYEEKVTNSFLTKYYVVEINSVQKI